MSNRKPSTPDQILARRFEQYRADQARLESDRNGREVVASTGGLSADILHLTHRQPFSAPPPTRAVHGLSLSTDKMGRVTHARRHHVFDLLFSARAIGPHQRNAGDEVMTLWAQAEGLAGQKTHEDAGFIDKNNTGASGVGEGALDFKMARREEYNAALRAVGGREAWLIHELCRDCILDTGRSWQAAVMYVYGEKGEKGLSMAVNIATYNLAVYLYGEGVVNGGGRIRSFANFRAEPEIADGVSEEKMGIRNS